MSVTPLVLVGIGGLIDANSGTLALTLPGGSAADDFILTWVQMKNTANAAPVPSGTWVAGPAQGGGSRTYWQNWDGSETFTLATSGNALFAFATVWRNPDPTTPILVSASGTNTADANMHYPARTVPIDGCAIQTFCVKNSAIASVVPASLPAAFTELVDHNCTSSAFGVHSQYLIETTAEDIPATTLIVTGGTNGATAQGIVVVLQQVVQENVIRSSSSLGTRRGSRQVQT